METSTLTQVRYHIFIEGKVQGVGFRNYIKRKAELLNITGWVKNLDDGRVEAVLEGEKMDVEQLIDHCYEGPRTANVHSIEEQEEEPMDEFGGFDVKL